MSELKYSTEVNSAIHIASAIAKEHANNEITPSHLLKAILHRSLPLRKELELLGKDVYYIENWVDFRIQKLPKSSKHIETPNYHKNTRAIFDEAENERLKYNMPEMDLNCILAAICIPGVGYNYEQLKTLPISQDEVYKNLFPQNTTGKLPKIITENKQSNPVKRTKENAISNYCTNKTADCEEGRLDPVVGRDKEIRLLTETLSRRSKPNAILVGDPGVGKTAIIDGLVQAIKDKKVTTRLQQAIIFELDMGALIAGASYKGEVEDRLRKIIAEVKEYEKAILFFDEIHLLLDKNGGAVGAANLLKPELAKGEITIIGATTQDEYAKYIEGDSAFQRRFEVIRVEEPTESSALQMLQEVMPGYVLHHGIELDDEVLKSAIQLSKRFSKDRKLPDSAIDLMDQAMAALQIMNESSGIQLSKAKDQFSEITKQLDDRKDCDEQLKAFFTHVIEELSYLLLDKVDSNREEIFLKTGNELQKSIAGFLESIEKLTQAEYKMLTPEDLTSVVSFKTGIPAGKLQSDEKERLLVIEEELNKRVIGQNHAIKEIAQAIRRSRAGIRKQNKPIGSFFLVGPTGTGKTELARTLADYLFQDENAMIRFDMSEFTEEASVSLLHGASPGYVGYEEGGLLVNEIRKNPYSVVLFDEIEKAHPGVFKIFFQILDEGKLSDKLGKEGDFTNSIILFTSNIGSEPIIEYFQKEKKLLPEATIKDQMKSYFPPALINRLDKIVPFAPIHEDVISLIFDINIRKVQKMLDARDITLEVSDKAKAKLSALGVNIEYGARPLIGVIRDYIETPLANMIIGSELNNGNTARVDMNEEEQFAWEIEVES